MTKKEAGRMNPPPTGNTKNDKEPSPGTLY